jgi:hypothetical protein
MNCLEGLAPHWAKPLKGTICCAEDIGEFSADAAE